MLSVLRVPLRVVLGLAGVDVILALLVFAPWQLVVLLVVLGAFALGYLIGRSEDD